MTIRIRTEELDEFKSNFTKIKNNVEELCGAMDKVTNKVVLENITAGSALISDVEKLNGDIYKLKEEIEYYWCWNSYLFRWSWCSILDLDWWNIWNSNKICGIIHCGKA